MPLTKQNFSITCRTAEYSFISQSVFLHLKTGKQLIQKPEYKRISNKTNAVMFQS